MAMPRWRWATTRRKRAGRLSLNPLRHVDRVGTILVPGVLLLSQLLTVGRVEFMFGWAKPVPVNILALRNPRRGMMLVAAAGPAMNFVSRLASPGWRCIRWRPGARAVAGDAIGLALSFLASASCRIWCSACSTCCRMPPLDGGRIIAGLLPRPLALPYMRLERWGILIVLFGVFLLPRLTDGFDPVGWALRQRGRREAFDLVLTAVGQRP